MNRIKEELKKAGMKEEEIQRAIVISKENAEESAEKSEDKTQ